MITQDVAENGSMADKLTPRQVKFIEAYSGNATDAARIAGYKGNDNVLGVTAHDLLSNPKIAQEIKSRQSKELDTLIATREERQKFWTDIMKNSEIEIRDRLRASELLGKSEADFIERFEQESNVNIKAHIKIDSTEIEDRISQIKGKK